MDLSSITQAWTARGATNNNCKVIWCRHENWQSKNENGYGFGLDQEDTFGIDVKKNQKEEVDNEDDGDGQENLGSLDPSGGGRRLD